ncbi:Mrp/NBP35 family ATP-binding protein [Sphingomonas sp. XMGL2]|uniref:Iron-sulfur cluster carrier protein n=2 Tax=Sphingomonas quercus TaxID=2842451 RepID=A0ABS6BG81_9SPHN|nr:Mrp/NBP35 family ATP-binding protein [Sphingomonas quercus]
MTYPEADALAAALARVTGIEGRAAAPRRGADGAVSVVLDVTGLDGDRRAALEDEMKRALGAVPGVTAVRVAQTAEKTGRRIIAVGSGKGGVGKSTLAANLAVALARAGTRTGLVDADIYGPSQPRLLSAEGIRPEGRDKTLLPVATRFGVPMLSMGQLVEPGQAIAWRGPMAGSALAQLLDADWGDCEVLIVDLPPGTGDVQLSMLQKHRPEGAVIVSTPQDLALIDAMRAIDLFGKTGVPVIGVVENMAGYICPHCGEFSDPFGIGGAESAAGTMGLPFLGRVPLDPAIRRRSDAGDPPAAGDEPEGEAFALLAARVRQWLDRPRA